MINNEIIIRQTELCAAIVSLKTLQVGTLFRYTDPDDLLMNTSISETSDAVIEMFQLLKETEETFQILLAKTIRAMEVAGISFEQADITAGTTFEDLPYMLVM